MIAGESLSVGLYGDLINDGAIDATDAIGNVTGTYDPMSYTLGLCLAKELDEGLAVGGTLRGHAFRRLGTRPSSWTSRRAG